MDNNLDNTIIENNNADINKDNQNIIKQILKNILNKLTLQDKYKIKLKDEILLIITQILDNNPEFFDLIEDIFNQIINDDNIVTNIFNFSYLSNHILKILDTFTPFYISNADFKC